MSIIETFRQKQSTTIWPLIGGIILVAFVAAIVSAIFYKPAKTNGVYLQELIDTHTLEQTATKFVTKLRASPETKDYKESEWKQIEEGLSKCLVKEATEYAASNDQYLNRPADMNTPTEFANRFLKACGAIE